MLSPGLMKAYIQTCFSSTSIAGSTERGLALGRYRTGRRVGWEESKLKQERGQKGDNKRQKLVPLPSMLKYCDITNTTATDNVWQTKCTLSIL